MKKVLSIAMAFAFAGAGGCNWSSRQGGGVAKDEGFKIVVPTFNTDVKQGETQSVNITLKRGVSFKRDVTLEFTPAKGISVDPTRMTVEAGDNPEVQVRISVAQDAAIGKYRVEVVGTPKTGEPTSTEFNVMVVAP